MPAPPSKEATRTGPSQPGAEARQGRLAWIRSSPVQLTLELDAAIYRSEAVERAADAFSPLARIVVRPGEQRQLIFFSEVGTDIRSRLLDEFANYALGCLVVEP